MARLSALRICHKVKILNFPHNFWNLKISAIIKDTHLRFPVSVLIVSREGKVSQVFYSGPSFYFMKC